MPPRHLYVHVPFCARRCTYCDFSIAVRRTTPVEEYLRALKAELAIVAREQGLDQPAEWALDTVYLGGGTPSQLGQALPRVLDLVRDVATIAPGAEVTIEANPEDVTPENSTAWRQAGVNRISLGSQSFDPAVLAWMHRVHSAEQIPRAVEIASDAGFDNISLDLIFALPKSLDRDWKRDLDLAVALDSAHISLYGLTIEPKTPLARWRDRGEVTVAGDDSYADEFLLAHDTLAAAGYDHYEVSNFSKPDLHSRHNSAYWSGAAYAGIGPSAHSFDGARRWWNVAPYAAWIGRLAAGTTPVAEVEVLDEENISNEKVYLGLRTQNGVRVAGAELAELQPWVDRGWARFSSVEDDAIVGRGVGVGTPSQERVSRRRSSSEGVPIPTPSAPIHAVGAQHSKLTLTANGWLLLDELATSLTCIRSRSYV